MLKRTTVLFLSAFLLLAVVHVIAVDLYLYWHFRWLDMPVHAYGGAMVALGLFCLRDLGLLKESYLRIVPVLVFATAIALLWEAFELAAGVPIIGNYFFDTAIDITLGVTGSAIGFYIGSRVSKQELL